MYKIAVIGTGYVGLTAGVGLASFGSNVMCLDINEEKIKTLKSGKSPIYERGMEELIQKNLNDGRIRFSTDIPKGIKWADIIFLAVGTPSGETGSADLSYIEKAAEDIGKNLNGYKIIVTKSTVPVGTNRKLKNIISRANQNDHEFDIVSNPEFLREGSAIHDFFHPDRVVVGTESSRPVEAIKKIYRPLYLNETPFVFTDLETAETIKYASNCFLAMKITFINELARFCDAAGANVQTIAKALGMDGRISPKFLHPGPGYGGSCFPKDTKALAYTARDLGSPLELVETTVKSNEEQKHYAAKKILKMLKEMKGKKVGILGLAFKSETDDMRDSSAIVIINDLLKNGVEEIKVFDPQAMENAKRILGQDKIIYCSNEYEVAKGVDVFSIVTEWNQFRNLDLQKIKSLMRGNAFCDLRNIYIPSEVREAGLLYEGMGIR